VVDINTGKVIGVSPNIPGWVGTKLGSHLKEYLNLPVYVDNDANSMALGELRFGAAKRFDNILCITVGTGIGGAVIINKELWRGSNFSAGELGHIVIDYNGQKCDCGNTGCLEKYCTGPAMLKLASEKLKDGMTNTMKEILSDNIENLSIKKLFSGAKKGDEIALSIIDQSAKILGAGLSGIINLLNPEAIVFGGGVIDGGAGYIEIVGAEIRKRSFATATENLRIVKAELGNNAGFIGAGLLGEYK
ncbi:MAG: ROK family protein, partial [candidate division Zixibacteria bacterium]|nr:ROK family protein [candidate division Zixibacteria bacterium]